MALCCNGLQKQSQSTVCYAKPVLPESKTAAVFLLENLHRAQETRSFLCLPKAKRLQFSGWRTCTAHRELSFPMTLHRTELTLRKPIGFSNPRLLLILSLNYASFFFLSS